MTLDERTVVLRLAGAGVSVADDRATTRRGVTSSTANLPAPLSSFIGRCDEVAQVRALVEAHRLVTVTGPGGAGKTRLAQRVAADVAAGFPDGAWWVELAGVEHPDAIAPAVARAMRWRDVDHDDLASALADTIGDGQVLLVLDNCEHLVAPVADLVHRMLVACSGLHLMTTSRTGLGVPGEITWRIPSMGLPLTTPPRLDDIVGCDAVALFVARARQLEPTFVLDADSALVVADICRRLDALPLAIELAAARCHTVGVNQLLAGLTDALDLLNTGARTALPRQRTLAASITWSYDLLTPAAQAVMRRTAVFSGGFSLVAAEAVVADDLVPSANLLDGIDDLVRHSLLSVQRDLGNVRFRMLETVRQFATVRLEEAGEGPMLRARHAAYFMQWISRPGAVIDGPEMPMIVRDLDADHDNIEHALETRAAAGAWDEIGRVVWPLVSFWIGIGRPTEQIWWLTRYLESGPAPSATHARVLYARADGVAALGRIAEAIPEAVAALAMGESVGDDLAAGRAGQMLGNALALTDPTAADVVLDTARERLARVGDEIGVGLVLLASATGAHARGDHASVSRYLDEADDLARRVRSPWFSLISFLRATTCLHRGELAAIGPLVATGRQAMSGVDLTSFAVIGDFCEIVAGIYAGAAEPSSGDVADRIARAQQSEAGLALMFLHLARGLRAFHDGELDDAQTAFDETVETGRAWGLTLFTGYGGLFAADVAHARGDLAAAEARIRDAQDAVSVLDNPQLRARTDMRRAALALDGHGDDDPEQLIHRAIATQVAGGYRVDLVTSLEILTSALAAREAWADAARAAGTTRCLRDAFGLRLRAEPERTRLSRDLADARGVLPAGEFARADEEGYLLGVDDGVAYLQRARSRRRTTTHGWASLTETERRVVALVADGLTNPQIAARLLMSRETVKTHVSHVLTKLGVATRAQVAVIATRVADV